MLWWYNMKGKKFLFLKRYKFNNNEALGISG